MSASKSQVFVLIGAVAGQSLAINGHEFVDGKYTFTGNSEQVDALTRIFSYYSAVPAEQAELMELRALAAGRAASAPVNEQTNQDPAASTKPAADDKALEAALTEVTLAEAISKLDPENDAHWTSNNLPSVDVLSSITGKKVTRDEVNTIADGYTRAKARAART
jgi:hypothetical protein